MNKTLFYIRKNMVNKLLSVLIPMKRTLLCLKNNILLTDRKKIEFLHMRASTFSAS